MQPLKCDLCDGTLTMNENGDFAVCDYCGVQYRTERLRVKVQEIKGVVEIIHGPNEKERLLNNAETFTKLNKYDEAWRIYATLQKDYPDDYIVWYRAFETTLTANITNNTYHHLSGFVGLNDLVETAVKLCDDNKKKEELITHSNALWEEYLSLPNTYKRFISDLDNPNFSDDYYDYIYKPSRNNVHLQEHIFVKQLNEWFYMHQGRCRHCGGVLKGIFSLKCVDCHKSKDY
ncbi:MAG: hypothetical protein IJZ82_12130 [Lachnospiraceae bacterium]|nr:hypothetical protein [Lachnospiraceae bacterium]